jgi:tetratricopeptide (TPR) repeat protein
VLDERLRSISVALTAGDLDGAVDAFISHVWPSAVAPEGKIRLLSKLRAVIAPNAAADLLERLYISEAGVAALAGEDPATRLRRASAEYRAGLLEQALVTIDSANVTSSAAQSLRSDILAGLGRRDEALAVARTVFDGNPDRTDCILLLVLRLIDAERLDEAIGVLEEAAGRRVLDERLMARIVALPLGPQNIERLFAASMAIPKRVAAARTREPAGAARDVESEVRSKLRKHLAAWEGWRFAPDALIVARNEAGRRPPLFWCFQDATEFARLSASLGPEQPVFGMRSGHLIIGYTLEEFLAVADCYVREMLEIRPDGPFQLGGNCQGGIVARLIATKLREAGRDVPTLILMEMEMASFGRHEGRVALLFGRDSNFNPYRSNPDPEALFDKAFPNGYSVDIIDGTHGHFFGDDNLPSLTAAVNKHLCGALD